VQISALTSSPIAHHATCFLFQHVGAPLAAGPQSPSVSVIQSRAQPGYARIEPGRKVLTPESPIVTFELTDKLAKVRGHICLYAKKALQTFPYLSANGLIVFCVNDAHVCVRPCEPLPELCLQFGNWRRLRSRVLF